MLCDTRWRRSIRALLLTVATSLGSGSALAHGGNERPLATVPTPPAGDGAKAAQILRELEARIAPPPGDKAPGTAPAASTAPATRTAATTTPAAKTPGGDAAAIVAEPVAQAKRALQRAHGARAAGDAKNARRLDTLALEWAETAQALLRAADAEAAAADAAKRAYEIETKVERARTLLAETQARRGRAAAELERVEAEARTAAQAAADAETQRLEAGRRPAAGGAKRGAPGAQRASRAASGDGQQGAGPAASAGKEGTP